MLFFFYGTLIDASDTSAARWLRSRLHKVEPASVAGRLFAIPTPRGWFPALVRGSPGQRVRGMSCDVALDRRDLIRLDRYEGREYRRMVARARAGSGLVPVQLYRWRYAVPRSAVSLPRGDFLMWLRQRGLRPYAAPPHKAARPAEA